MRGTLRLGALALTALFAFAACSTSGASTAPTASAAPPASVAASEAPSVAPSPSADACAKENLALIAPGKLTWARTTRPTRPTSRRRTAATRRPGIRRRATRTAARASRARSPTRSPSKLGFAPDRGRLGRRAVRQLVRAGRQDLRLRPQPGRLQAGAGADRRPHRRLLLRQPDDRGPQVEPDRQGDHDRRVGRTRPSARRSARRATTRSSTSSSRPRKPRSTTRTTRAIQALKTKAIDAIVVDLPTADFLANVQIENSTIVGQLDQGTPEHFSAGSDQGQQADRLPQPGHRRPDRRTAPSRGWPTSICRSRRAPRSSSRDRSRPSLGRPRWQVWPPGPATPGCFSGSPGRGARTGARHRGSGALRSTLIAFVSTVVFFIVVGLVVVNAPGWTSVQTLVPRRPGLRRLLAGHRPGLLGECPHLPRRRGPDPLLRPGHRGPAQPARSGPVPRSAPRHRLRRRLPGPARRSWSSTSWGSGSPASAWPVPAWNSSRPWWP